MMNGGQEQALRPREHHSSEFPSELETTEAQRATGLQTRNQMIPDANMQPEQINIAMNDGSQLQQNSEQDGTVQQQQLRQIKDMDILTTFSWTAVCAAATIDEFCRFAHEHVGVCKAGGRRSSGQRVDAFPWWLEHGHSSSQQDGRVGAKHTVTPIIK